MSQQVTHRTGAALVRATFPFAEEHRLRTWTELAITVGLFASTEGLALAGPLPVKPVGTVLSGLLLVRLFIIYHDALHGAVFRGDWLGQRAMDVIGLLTLSPRSVWRETHDYHHRNNCKLPGTAIGSYPVVTTRQWRRMKSEERRAYTFARHPMTMLFGYVFIFLAGMCASAFLRDPRQHWASGVAPLLHAALVGLAWWAFGPLAALAGVVGPLFIACALGSYLFYAQHNFPDVELARRDDWTYHHAALKSSSFFRMSPVMHFFTGNIGYHHIHHLNPKIPFYRLPEVMAALPELQAPGETSWAIADIRAALALKLWDPSTERMVPFPSANQGPSASAEPEGAELRT